MDHADKRNGQDRSADIPRDISEQGWWSILKRVYADLDNKNISVLAAGIAFYAMLSIFPALAVLIAVYGILANPTTVQHLTDTMHGIMPGEAQKLIDGLSSGACQPEPVEIWDRTRHQFSGCPVERAIRQRDADGIPQRHLRRTRETRDVTFLSDFFCLDARGHGLRGHRPDFYRRRTGDGAAAALSEKAKIIGALAPWPILLVFVAVGLATVYRYAPCRREPGWRWVSWGSIGATILWMTASAVFSFYVAKFNSYEKTFGSLGAVVVLLTWLYLSAYAVLLGACLNAEMERQAANPATIGSPKMRPIGTKTTASAP